MNTHDRGKDGPPTKSNIVKLFLEREVALMQVEVILAANRAEVAPLVSLAEEMGGRAAEQIRQRNDNYTSAANRLLDKRVEEALGLVEEGSREEFREAGLHRSIKFWERRVIMPNSDTIVVALGQRRLAIIQEQLSPPQANTEG